MACPLQLRQVSLPSTAFKVKPHQNFVQVLCCFVPYTPILVPRPLWEILTYAMCTPWHSGGSRCSQGIFTGLKHREFWATFVLFCAVYAEFCAMFLVADSDIMPCVHCCILVGLSVPKEFLNIWSTVNFVLLLCCFMPHTPNFVPRRLWDILTYDLCTPWHSGGSK